MRAQKNIYISFTFVFSELSQKAILQNNINTILEVRARSPFNKMLF